MADEVTVNSKLETVNARLAEAEAELESFDKQFANYEDKRRALAAKVSNLREIQRQITDNKDLLGESLINTVVDEAFGSYRMDNGKPLPGAKKRRDKLVSAIETWRSAPGKTKYTYPGLKTKCEAFVTWLENKQTDLQDKGIIKSGM